MDDVKGRNPVFGARGQGDRAAHDDRRPCFQSEISAFSLGSGKITEIDKACAGRKCYQAHVAYTQPLFLSGQSNATDNHHAT
jgi:hypothetical protein